MFLSGWNRVNCTPKFQGYSNLPPSTFPPSPLLLAAEEDPALSMGAEEEESLWTDLVPRIPSTMDRATEEEKPIAETLDPASSFWRRRLIREEDCCP